MVRIVFTGAQGTGKTTILNQFQREGYNVITEVVRKLSKEGVKINEMGNGEGQNRIFNEYMKLLSERKEYISDRGLTDVLAYTKYLESHTPFNDPDVANIRWQLTNQREMLRKFLKENPDVTFCYFPIEFDVVNDGVRSLDENFRKEIDYNIKSILEEYNIPYITITGTVENRLNTCEDVVEYTKYRNRLFNLK